MSGHLTAGFGPLDLEGLAEAEQRAALQHLDACDACAADYRAAGDALTELALALPAVQPPPELRERVLQKAAAASRFERFVEKVAGIADVTVEAARALLAKIDDAASWVASPLPGVELYHLQAGPACADAVVGFVRIKPGHVFPDHTHEGDEVALVLQGSCIEQDGRVSRRGDLVQMGPGTSHELTALPGPDFIYIAAAHKGFKIFGQHVGPDHKTF